MKLPTHQPQVPGAPAVALRRLMGEPPQAVRAPVLQPRVASRQLELPFGTPLVAARPPLRTA